MPYIWFGTLLQFGGLAIMPFALIVLSGDANGPLWIGYAASALAFLLVGAGLHTAQTAGLALATDLAPTASRPRVVAFLYVTLLLGMVASALVFGRLLAVVYATLNHELVFGAGFLFGIFVRGSLLAQVVALKVKKKEDAITDEASAPSPALAPREPA